jgi:hypothetical protein
MTDFGLMFSKKYKIVNWSSAEQSCLKKQIQFIRTAYCVLRIAEWKKDKNERKFGIYSC